MALDDDELPSSDPDSTCAYHEGRPAFVRCPVCGHDVCVACFFADVWRCQRCIEAAPEDLSDPVPFESPGGLRGFFGSIAAGFAPRRTATSFAIPTERRRGFAFFVLTFVPVAFLAGVIPYTRLLHFGPSFKVEVTPGSDAAAIALDVLRGGGLGLAQSSVLFGLFGACFHSLAKGFGRPEAGGIVLRALAYKAFLLPLGGPAGLLFYFVAVAAPAGVMAELPALLLASFPTLALAVGMHRVARGTGRVDAGTGFATTVVPLLLLVVSLYLSDMVMQKVVPLPTPG